MGIVYSKKIPPNRFKDAWRDYYTKNPVIQIPDVGIIGCSVDDIPTTCKSIVADFDTELLEPERLFR